jgi:hypothetical protein
VKADKICNLWKELSFNKFSKAFLQLQNMLKLGLSTGKMILAEYFY